VGGLRLGCGRKLLAAKRPALIPNWDTKVAGALFRTSGVNDWQAWRERCAKPVGDELARLASDASGGMNPRLELPRVFKAVLWSVAPRHFGDGA
jgi:hypothetical protein